MLTAGRIAARRSVASTNSVRRRVASPRSRSVILARALEQAVRAGDLEQLGLQLPVWEVALRQLADDTRDWMAGHG